MISSDLIRNKVIIINKDIINEIGLKNAILLEKLCSEYTTHKEMKKNGSTKFII